MNTRTASSSCWKLTLTKNGRNDMRLRVPLIGMSAKHWQCVWCTSLIQEIRHHCRWRVNAIHKNRRRRLSCNFQLLPEVQRNSALLSWAYEIIQQSLATPRISCSRLPKSIPADPSIAVTKAILTSNRLVGICGVRT